MSLWSVGLSCPSSVPSQLLVQHKLYEGFAEEQDRGNVRRGSYGCFGWEDAHAQTQLEWTVGLLQLAIRQVPS